MYDLIDSFIQSAKEVDKDVFPYLANKKEFVGGEDNVYYSGPYWDDLEVRELIHSTMKGKWAFLLVSKSISLNGSFQRSLTLSIL